MKLVNILLDTTYLNQFIFRPIPVDLMYFIYLFIVCCIILILVIK